MALLTLKVADSWAIVLTLATDLVDIPAVSMPIARYLKTCEICCIVLSDKTF